jgi:hypothetical protein
MQIHLVTKNVLSQTFSFGSTVFLGPAFMSSRNKLIP